MSGLTYLNMFGVKMCNDNICKAYLSNVSSMKRQVKKITEYGIVDYLENTIDRLLVSQNIKNEFKNLIKSRNIEVICEFYWKQIGGKNDLENNLSILKIENKEIQDIIDNYNKGKMIKPKDKWKDDCNNLEHIVLNSNYCIALSNISREVENSNKDLTSTLESMKKNNQNSIEKLNELLKVIPIELPTIFGDSDNCNITSNYKIAIYISAAIEVLKNKNNQEIILNCLFENAASKHISLVIKESSEFIYTKVFNFLTFSILDILASLWKILLSIYFLYKAINSKTEILRFRFYGEIAGLIGRMLAGKYRRLRKVK